MEQILQWDQDLFYLINSVWTTDGLNWLMPWLRNKLFWTPAYVFLISFLFLNYGRKALFFILFAILTIAIADTVSSKIIKKSVQRVRPCNDPWMADSVDLKVECGGGYSFTSSHATNHFALAFFLIFTLGRRFRKAKWVLIVWASSIAYAQVYVGVHYPFDVISGGLLGASIGILEATIYDSFVRRKIDWEEVEYT